jgi:hydroxymethylpyrimidine/phosphomethylpyrimidine kinase
MAAPETIPQGSIPRKIIPNLLSIAGSDPSAGAGIQADLKTFAALGCYGLCAITALTVQNTQGVFDVSVLPAAFVAAQIDALFADSTIRAVKIGMLGSAEIAETVADRLARYKPPFVVLDPVLASSGGKALATASLAKTIVARLAPHVTLITPNLIEAAELAGMELPRTPDAMKMIAKALHQSGFAAVLVKGGHSEGASADDILFDGTDYQTFSLPRLATRNTHGTGCTLSSAIAANLARGQRLAESIAAAKHYLQAALQAADGLSVGKGAGPLDHFHRDR